MHFTPFHIEYNMILSSLRFLDEEVQSQEHSINSSVALTGNEGFGGYIWCVCIPNIVSFI